MLIQDASAEKIIDKVISLTLPSNMGVILLVGEGSVLDVNKLITLFNKKNILFLGAVFPKIIYDEESYDDGVVIMPIQFVDNPQVITGLNDGEILMPDLERV